MIADVVKASIRLVIRVGLRYPLIRTCMNVLAHRSPLAFKKRVHSSFGMIFANYNGDWVDGECHIHFRGKKIKIPLHRNTLNIDWITALTLVGHDLEEKQTYTALLKQIGIPDIFLDVGGDLGTHSLMLLSQGVSVIYVEPNEVCHVHFERFCKINGFSCVRHRYALGAAEGSATLSFPPEQTWLGSTNLSRMGQLVKEVGPMVDVTVAVSTIDKLLAGLERKELLIKIDAEGAELEILEGSRAVFAKHKPTVMFESHLNGGGREAIWNYFDHIGYEVLGQPWTGYTKMPMNKHAFAGSQKHNFIAMPKQKA